MDKIFSRRVFIILAFEFVLLAVLIGRLLNLGVFRHKKYSVMSMSNFIKSSAIAPSRGRIIDRNYNLMAEDHVGYDLVITSEARKNANVDDIVLKVGRLIPIPQDRVNAVLDPKHKSNVLKERITNTEIAIMEAYMFLIDGIQIRKEYVRKYIFGKAACHILGYTGIPNKKQIKKYEGIEKPYIGKVGLEFAKNDKLFGIVGSQVFEMDAIGNKVRFIEYTPPIKGKDERTTVDIDLQKTSYYKLEPYKVGSFILLDLKNGDILSMVSYPSYNPNLITYYNLKDNEWKNNIANSEKDALINRSTHGLYSPGSIFKVVVITAAIEHNVRLESVYCDGVFSYNRHYKYHCWRSHGLIAAATDAIAQSCDIYFYKLALRIGIDKIAETSRKLGFGSLTGIEISEKHGIVPDREWKMRNLNQMWQKGETIIAGIGQGFMTSTPLEMLVSLSNLVTNTRITPRLSFDSPIRIDSKPLVSKRAVKTVNRAMYEVVNTSRGTGRTAFSERIVIAGKTATVQVRNISKYEREFGVLKNEDLPWRKRDHGIFFGYAPYHKPRFAAIAIAEHIGGGSKVAPLVKSVLEHACSKYLLGGDS